jgi:hypothetical protein
MAQQGKPRIANIVGRNMVSPDISQQNVYNIARETGYVTIDTNDPSANIEIDREVRNLVNWLADQQDITPERALKKAVLLAAYIQDVTTNQGGKLLVQRKDNSLGEIILK